MPVVFGLYERVKPKAAFNFFTAALNMRLNTTEDKNITEIAAIAAE